jgi:CHAT domain-containing protein
MKKLLVLGAGVMALAGYAWAQDVGVPASEPSPGAAVRQTAPPPTIADLVLLLRSYQPDAERIQRLRQALNAPLPVTEAPADLAIAWHQKALAAEELQEVEKRTDYLEKALGYARQSQLDATGIGGAVRVQSEYAHSLWYSQGITRSQQSYAELAAQLEGADRNKGMLINLYMHIISNDVHLADLDHAQQTQAKADQLLRQLASRPRNTPSVPNWASMLERSRGFTLQRLGRVEEAERAFLAALRQAQESDRLIQLQEASGKVVNVERRQSGADQARIFLAQIYAQQQRLDEAELLLREVIKRSLVREGRNSFTTGRALWSLARVFIERGRNAEAAVLAEWGDRALQEAGISANSPVRMNGRNVWAASLVSTGRAAEAVQIFDGLRETVQEDDALSDGFGKGTLTSILAYLQVGRFDDALRDGTSLLASNSRAYGATHYYTAEARAYRAMALNRLGRVDEARREFAQAIEVLTDPDKVVGKQQSSVARTRRLRSILNEYLNVLVGSKGARTEQNTAEAFRVADVARWQSVQKALAGSALRAASGSPELGAKIKAVQDADDELQAVYKNLITQRSAPPDRQLPAVIKAMEQRIAELQKLQQRDLVEIRRRFPQYDALVNPRPADVATARRALKPNEALLSVYVTPAGSYVWAVGAQGAVQFHFSPRKPDWVAAQVKRLRDSVDLTTGLPFDRLRFDLAAGLALYQELLAPVESAWAQADTLLVVANDALGQIPFSMLPTRELSPAAAASTTPGLLMSQYRQVPWLARQVAVAYLPSVSALVTLRALPAAQSRRDPFVGFGDPDFGSGGTAGTRGVARSGTRNLKIQHAANWDEQQSSADATVAPPPVADETPTLTALPDTREEITAIATALQADVQRDAYFGAQANRQNVVSADLKRRRIVAFATHGLVAGDLPGLDQPALALSPAPGQSIRDGLLKLEDILKLNLDADLVVLSACNTAAADGTGAEAVSGLGRGFFYAGARSVLATHWPVETVSARELVTHLFERYARDGQLTRAQALRRAMLDLIDNDVVVDVQGKPVMAYAHPAFWAPYALYGDPGR